MKNVIVTGGAKGIGMGIVKKLASCGYSVFIADNDRYEGTTAAEELGCTYVYCDVANENSVIACVNLVSGADGIYALINNAGIASPKRTPISEMTLEEWNTVISVNLTGAFLFSRYCAPAMNKGYIVNIASTRAFQSEKDTFAYSASKGGLVALTHSLAVSLGPDIIVNSISPGWINTDQNYIPTEQDNSQHPAGRVGIPDDIAEAAEFLISGRADFICGQNLTVDGGMTKSMIYRD